MKKLFLLLILFISTNVFSAQIYRDFAGVSLINTYNQLDDDYDALALSRLEIDSIYNYSLETFKDINPGLRQLNLVLLTNHKSAICALDKAITKYKIKNLTLYRGTSFLPRGADRIGYQFNEKAFTSTSVDKGVALNFATSNAPYVLDIIDTSYTPAHGLWLNRVSESQEEEILLARDTSFRVDRVTKMYHSGKDIIVRYLSIVEQDISLEVKNMIHCN